MTFSVVVPVYNEEAVVPLFLKRLLDSSKSWGECEVIFVDDGSTDRTFSLLKNACRGNSRFKALSFSRNFGHQVAVSAGLQYAKGEAVAVIDGDLQDPPEVIERMLQKWRDGYKIIYGVRRNRKEHAIKRLLYALFYRMMKMISRIDIPLDAGDFCLMDRAVVSAINSLPERNRFVRGLRAWTGFSSIGVEYDRASRQAGASKYTLRKLMRLAFDGFTGFSTMPLKLSAYIGFSFAALSFASGVWFLVLKLWIGIAVPGWTSLVLAVFFMGGIQLFILGVMGEYLGRVYTEVQNRPLYILKEKIGID